MSRSVAPQFVLAVGAASAVVLGAAALLDVGDPRAGARAELERAAVTRASEVQLAWERLLRSPTPPAPALGLDLTFDPTVRDARFGATRATDGSAERSPLFDVLLDAAVAAGRSGDLGAALTAVEDALEREPDAARAAAATRSTAAGISGRRAQISSWRAMYSASDSPARLALPATRRGIRGSSGAAATTASENSNARSVTGTSKDRSVMEVWSLNARLGVRGAVSASSRNASASSAKTSQRSCTRCSTFRRPATASSAPRNARA